MNEGLRRLRFEPDVEAAFLADHARRAKPVIWSFFGISGSIVLVGAISQMFTGKEELRGFINVALGLIVPLCILSLLATYARWYGRFMQPLLFLSATTIGCSVLYVWHTFPGERFPYYGPLAAALLIPIVYSISRLRFYWACASAWLICGLYMWMAMVARNLNEVTQYQPIYVMMTNLFGMLAGFYLEYAQRRDFLLNQLLDKEKQRTEEVLANIVPAHIAARLKDSDGVMADQYEQAFVLFADIVDFTEFASTRAAKEVVRALDDVFSELDDLATAFELEKIKTIGDAYMVVAGVPEAKSDDLQRICDFAVSMRQALASRSQAPFKMRIGIHCGPVVAGVIGRTKLVYDLWGDTVNTASRLESTGLPGEIQVSAAMAQLIDGHFRVLERGVVKLKGKGSVKTYLLYAHDEPEQSDMPRLEVELAE